MSRSIFYFLIFYSLLFLSADTVLAEKKICMSRFDPTQNDFSFEIQSRENQCRSNEKEIKGKKEKFGIWTFLPFNEINPKNLNEEKYGPADSFKE